MAAPNTKPFDCSIVEKLKEKTYIQDSLQRNDVNNLNIISFGAERFRMAMSETCKVVYKTQKENHVTNEMMCGHTRLLSFTCKESQSAKEELALHCEGKIPFGKDCDAKLSWWSSWRTKSKLGDMPHVAVVGAGEVDWAAEICANWGIPVYKLPQEPLHFTAQITSGVKAHLVELLLMSDPTKFVQDHHRGFQAGLKESESSLRALEERARQAGREKAQADGLFRTQLQIRETTFPTQLCDPTTQTPMKDPVITRTGTTHERRTILSHMYETGKEPRSGILLRPEDLVRNRIYRDLLRCVGLDNWVPPTGIQ